MISFPPALILIIGALLLIILPRQTRPAAFLVFPALAFVWLIYLSPGDNLSATFLNTALIMTRVDELSLAFGYIFVIITFIGGIYAYHNKNTTEQIATLLYAGSSLGVVFAGDLLTLVIFWEIMAVASAYLIWARGTSLARGAGMRYLMMHLLGGSILIAGVLLHISQTGSAVFNPMEAGLSSYLILLAFCINAAVPPLHAWLTDAYPEGTITGTVFLGAFTTKTAVYALARGFAGWEMLIWVGIAMAIYGVVFVIPQNDLRRLLSYHIVSQVGYMIAAIGLGSALAVDGATAHAINNILYKSLLLMAAGAVLFSTGKSTMSELGGLFKSLPGVFILYMIAAFAISGVPFFNGFVSKSLITSAAAYEGIGLAVILLNLAAVGTFLSITLKLPYFTWFAEPHPVEVKKLPVGMYIAMAITGLICLITGLFPQILFSILPYPIEYRVFDTGHIIETVQLLVFATIGFCLLVKISKPKAGVVLDFDWFYRRPGKLTYQALVVPVNKFFGLVENLSLRAVHYLTAVSINPVYYLYSKVRWNNGFSAEKKSGLLPVYDPDKQRYTMEPIVIIVVVFIIGLLGWGLIRL
ncbi:MAG TPA: Na(+)/H(+) antiporter subunit D [Dehalococcoidales bacterium]|nr:Na(+)/H(+) antiporter subunit D [Dehalococcoidales bacterium]